ncbi:MAG: hypothetical protein V3U02_11210, partial [Calditrichia bacterium]
VRWAILGSLRKTETGRSSRSGGIVLTHPVPLRGPPLPASLQGGDCKERMYSLKKIALVVSRDLRKNQTPAEIFF